MIAPNDNIPTNMSDIISLKWSESVLQLKRLSSKSLTGLFGLPGIFVLIVLASEFRLRSNNLNE